jgi:ribonuclease BN (tRNA processing enzyme)
MVKITALGTGSAFCMNNWQTNFLIERPTSGKCLLVDCGGDIRFSLKEAGPLGLPGRVEGGGVDWIDIDAVYISHAHADHVGGMEALGFIKYFCKLPRPKLFAEYGLLFRLWDNTLRGGMEGLEGIDANIETYFDIRPVGRSSSFEWEDIKFDLVQSVHISARYRLVDSYGLMFTDPENGKRIYLTTDVQFSPETSMKAYYKEADLIVHDCETMYKSGVHAHYDQLVTLPPEIKAKMLLTHYQDNVSDPRHPAELISEYWQMIPPEVRDRIDNQYHLDHHNFADWQERAKQDGFAGFIKRGSVFYRS